MRAFLFSIIAMLVIAIGTYEIFGIFLRENAGTAFSRPSARVSDSYKPNPDGSLSHEGAPAGGVTAGRSQTGQGKGSQ
jgi:hypothetical protein